MYELRDESNPSKIKRFAKLFCGWAFVAIFIMLGLMQLSKSQESPTVTSNFPEITTVRDIFTLLLTPLFIGWFWFTMNERPTKRKHITKNWIYRESMRPNIRIIWKGILGYCAFAVSMTVLVEHSTHTSLLIGFAILSCSLFYQIFSQRFLLTIFQSPNQFEISGVKGKFAAFFPLFSLIPAHDILLKLFLKIISSPVFTVILSIIGFVFAFLGFKGISIKKTHQHNPNLRSIVSYPIAIQFKDQTPLNEQQIYDTVIKCCPKSQIFFEKTSKGFYAKKAEIIVIDWEEYDKKNIQNKRNNLHLKIIDALTNRNEEFIETKELEVLNFIIEHRPDGHIKSVTPIKNNAAKLFCKIKMLRKLKNIFRWIHSKNTPLASMSE